MTVSAAMIKEVPAMGGSVPSSGKPVARKNRRFRGIARLGKTPVLLEVADTPERRQKGLMGRRYLPFGCGMLFTDLSGGAFWMKGCHIPLDIIFLDEDGTVTRQYGMLPDGGARRYPYADETTAIELPYGFCAEKGIRAGTSCTWRIFT